MPVDDRRSLVTTACLVVLAASSLLTARPMAMQLSPVEQQIVSHAGDAWRG